jgi:cytidylate kinase
MPGFVIAIDGPAASGKGTVSAGLAKLYGYPLLDTGLLYRAVGMAVKRAGGDLDSAADAAAAAEALDAGRLEDPSLRTGEAGEAASRVAVHEAVRQALRGFQRRFAAQEPGAILDGRDIGTVIAPDAPAKLFVTAAPEVRAHRRWLQLNAADPSVTLEAVLADIRERDERDSNRAASPLTRADDAVLLDTSEMTIDLAADAARRIVEAARGRWEQSHKG